VSVADVIYDVVESFVAKCEAEAELEMKIIKFPNIFLNEQSSTDRRFHVPDCGATAMLLGAALGSLCVVQHFLMG
jgi:hypothetical protein